MTTRRHRLALPLAVGGSVLMTGLLAAGLLASADGCVPGAQAVVYLRLGRPARMDDGARLPRPVRPRPRLLRRDARRAAGSGGEPASDAGSAVLEGMEVLDVLTALAVLAVRGVVEVLAVLAGTVVRPGRRGEAVAAPAAAHRRVGRGRRGRCRGLPGGAGRARPSKAEAMEGGQWLPDVMLWTAATLGAVAMVTAVVVALRARGPWWPALAIGAATVSLLAGLGAATALTMAEGCLPGPTTLWSGCHPRSGSVWQLTRLLLPPRLLALAVPAAALTVLVVLALRALPPAPPEVRRRRRMLRGAYVVAACLAPVLLLSGQRELVAFASPSTPEGRQGERAREKARQRAELRVWLDQGGRPR